MRSESTTAENVMLARCSGVPALLILLVLLLVGTAWRLGLGEFKGEEGRRAIAAREMISSGDGVVPTVWGEPYLNKPPGYPWAVAISSGLTGEVNPLAVRIPAYLSFVGLAVAMFFLGRRWGGNEGGLLTSFLLVSSIEMQKKAMIGETDLMLTLGIAVYALGMLDREWKVRHLFLACGGLLIAGFAKGPAALPFVAGLIVCRFLRDGYSLRGLVFSVGPLLFMGASLGLWYLLVQDRLAQIDVLSYWQSETLRNRTGAAPFFSFRHMSEFVVGSVLGMIPAVLVLLEPKRWISSWREKHWSKASILASLGIPSLIFFFWPDTQPRYLLPLMPILCFWAGPYLVSHQEGLGLRIFGFLLRTLLCLGAVWVFLEAWWGTSQVMDLTLSAAWGITAWSLATLGIALIPENRCRVLSAGALSRILLLLFSVSVIQLVWIVPSRTAETPAGDFARWVEERVPESETVWVAVEDHWNELATIKRFLRGRSLAPEEEAGGWILEEVPENGSQDVWRLKNKWVSLKPWTQERSK
jgi:4-amino-4-deoxy-L-arabinose transferase-like glycosyltransferase